MTGLYATIAAILTAAALAASAYLARSWLKARKRSRGRERNRLWELFYGLDWGDVTTNNYGFAPAEGQAPERHQLQMYAELLKMLRESGRLRSHMDLLEVSCGRGGGLAHLVRHWPGSIKATGMDYSENALAACRRTHEDIDGLTFVHGSALELPFPDRSFDAVLNVEASNDYGDYAAFFREVRRVLRPGGVFLYCDSRRARQAASVAQMMRDAGLEGAFRDITDNVVEACRLDSDRRRRLIRTRVPWLYWLLFRKELCNYAAVEGSRKFEAFRTRRRVYTMTCAIKAEA